MTATRNALMRKLHAQARALGLDEETYRSKLEAITGSRSAGALDDAALTRAVEAFADRAKPAVHAHHSKIKALYLAAWNLGLFDSGRDAALDAFVKRQCGKERLAFVAPHDAAGVVEALKAMCAREGFNPPDDGMEARRRLCIAQWRKLARQGKVRIADEGALNNFVSTRYLSHHGALIELKRHQLDDCAKALGSWIRK